MGKKYILVLGMIILTIGILIWGAYTPTEEGTAINNPNATVSPTPDNDTSSSGDNGEGPIVVDNTDTNGSTQNSRLKDFSFLLDEDYIEYEVLKGDTLASISRKYSDVCPTPLLSRVILITNDLNSSRDVKEGMTLKIPVRYIEDGINYTIEAGDSLTYIASTFLVDMDLTEAIDMLIRDNLLSNALIKVGDELFISSGYAEEMPVSNPGNLSSNFISAFFSEMDFTEYTVEKGDSLSTIAKQYSDTCPTNIASKIILEFNNMKATDRLKEGSTLKIPEDFLLSGIRHTVESGDTLIGIAEEYLDIYDLTEAINHIIKLNFLDSSTIRIGQELFITNYNLE
jgi:LysM repeat protein